jgi:membrane-associated HD superfamily phosphohydrolase
MAMKRLQDGQFDECDLSLQELSRIETSMSKTLAAHYHGRVAYPTSPDMPDEPEKKQS